MHVSIGKIKPLHIFLVITIIFSLGINFIIANAASQNDVFAHTSEDEIFGVLKSNPTMLVPLNQDALELLGTPADISCGSNSCLNSINDDGSYDCYELQSNIFAAGKCTRQEDKRCSGSVWNDISNYLSFGFGWCVKKKDYYRYVCISETFPTKGDEIISGWMRSASDSLREAHMAINITLCPKDTETRRHNDIDWTCRNRPVNPDDLLYDRDFNFDGEPNIFDVDGDATDGETLVFIDLENSDGETASIPNYEYYELILLNDDYDGNQNDLAIDSVENLVMITPDASSGVKDPITSSLRAGEYRFNNIDWTVTDTQLPVASSYAKTGSTYSESVDLILKPEFHLDNPGEQAIKDKYSEYASAVDGEGYITGLKSVSFLYWNFWADIRFVIDGETYEDRVWNLEDYNSDSYDWDGVMTDDFIKDEMNSQLSNTIWEITEVNRAGTDSNKRFFTYSVKLR